VIDADAMSRAMTAAGGKAMPYIREHFGPDYINEDGSLNRVAMRDLVFRNPRYKAILEEGTTKVVLQEILNSVKPVILLQT
jgi:dephospho-CoA kinase